MTGAWGYSVVMIWLWFGVPLWYDLVEMEERYGRKTVVHRSCWSSGRCELALDTVAALCCILVCHWAGVCVILFSHIAGLP